MTMRNKQWDTSTRLKIKEIFDNITKRKQILNIINNRSMEQTTRKGRNLIWSGLTSLSGQIRGSWLLLGDFNEIRNAADIVGEHARDRQSTMTPLTTTWPQLGLR